MNDAPIPAWRGWAFFAVTAVIACAVGLLVASIIERRAEAVPVQPATVIGATESDNAKWGINHPRQFASFKQMADADHPTATKHGGSFKRDLLEETTANVVLFAGYAFAKDYKQARGHAYAVQDVHDSLRPRSATDPTQWNPNFAATCWTCKSPDVPRLMAEMGPEKFYASRMVDLKDEIKHPIGCLDCHDPTTMALRITRPALVEAFQRQGKDITQASHQEMRTLVCAQCHVEYYFKKEPKNYLTFPWDEGTGVEDMERYYTKVGFTDWTHAISKTPMIKMQHPDYEVYSKGIHAYRNVSCADCHMPYKTEGGRKFTDHHVQSPLNNIANSCAVCHRWSEDEIRTRVEGIQDKVHQGRVMAEDALTKAHFDIAACMQASATDGELAGVRGLVRAAQLRWDYVAANNGMGFHAPQECQRILAAATDLAQQARLECVRILAAHGHLQPVTYPDTGTKAKAQALIKEFIAGHPPKLL